MAQHAKIGPSALHRLLACPGSYALEEYSAIPRSTPSIYAAEGTVAHQVCEDAITVGGDPGLWLGKVVEQDGFSIEVTDDMVEGCQAYVDLFNTLAGGGGGKTSRLEYRVSLEGLWAPNKPPEPIFGTVDAFIYDEAAARLSVLDFKFGRGDVSPEENPQAMAYALGLILTIGISPGTDVHIYIVQPRSMAGGQKVKAWETTASDLLDWGHKVLKPGVNAMRAANGTLDELKPGGHCKFCPAAGFCPALKGLAQRTAKDEFGGLKDPSAMSNDDLADTLNELDLLKQFIAAAQAEASARLDKGQAVPGWKLVPKRAARRYTVPQSEIEDAIKAGGFDPAGIMDWKLPTPAQLDKKAPDIYEMLGDLGLVEKSSSGTTLAPVSDPRGARADKKASNDFTAT